MKKNIKFEEAIASLEDITRRLDSGELALDESLIAFEEGIKLIKLCNEKLENAEQKVRILTENSDGVISDLPFAEGDDET